MLLVDAESPEPVRSGAHELVLFLTPEPGAELLAASCLRPETRHEKEAPPRVLGSEPSAQETVAPRPELNSNIVLSPESSSYCVLRCSSDRGPQNLTPCSENWTGLDSGSERRFRIFRALEVRGLHMKMSSLGSRSNPWIRSDISQIVEENVPGLKAKVTEMRGIYAKVDRLEAFVRMVGHHAALLEAHVRQAERDHGAFPRLRRWLGSTGFPSFRNAPLAPRPPASQLPVLYRTEDYVPLDTWEAERQSR
ncbi:LOW QUALITY PROTEIN: breast carcinoma-amplified sequence 4 [Callospermophilus lateralis]